MSWLFGRKYFGKSYTPYISDGDSARVLCFMNLSGAYNGFAGVEEAEKDAKKMAAALELYEACKAIMDDVTDSDTAFKMVYKAIQKAEGK